MKKLLVFLLTVLTVISATACSGSDKNSLSGIHTSDEGSSGSAGSESSPNIDIADYDIISPVSSVTGIGAPKLGSFAEHGGNQTRIAKTSHGIYVTYLSGDTVTTDGGDYNPYSLVRVDAEAGTAVEIYNGLCSVASNSPYVMADKDENVWVVCGDTASTADGYAVKSCIWKYDHTTKEVTEYNAEYVVPVPDGGYGYAMGFIDNYTNQIYLVHFGGDKIGMFAIIRFDITTSTYVDVYKFKTYKGRHAYAFGFSDGKGGFSIVAQRDISIEATGNKEYFQNNDYWANYVWDDLRLFSFTVNEENKVVQTGTYEVDLADYVQSSLLFPQNIHYRSGDTFIDNAGNMHVIYRSAYDEGVAQIVERHVILNSNYEIIYKGEIKLDEKYISSEIKMYQTTEGIYYLAVMPKKLALPEGELPSGNPENVGQSVSEVSDAVIQLYRSEDGISFTKVYEEELEGEKWAPYHISATQPRNGSIIDNKLGLMISADSDWKYAVVDLDAVELLFENGLLPSAE